MDYTYDVTMFKETFEHEFTYLNGFMRNVARFAEHPAMLCPLTGRRWTYRSLNADVNRLAHALQGDGVKKNDVIMYMLLNSAEFVFSYLAAQKVGAVNCPVNYRQAPGELALIIDDSHPKVFVYDAEFGEMARQALDLATYKPERIIVVDLNNEAVAGEGETTYRDYIAGMPDTDPVRADKPHIYDEVTRLYTSGTTNRPKGVPMNNVNEVLSAHDVMMHFPLNSTDRTMNMTPWFHRGGLHSGGPNPTLYAGGELIILRDFSPRRALQYAEEYKVTFLIGVPTIIAMLARAQEGSPADLSALRGIVTMGAPFEKAACEKYLKLLTPNIFNGYGTTESFWNTFLRPYNLPEMAGSAGQSCTDDEVRVVRACEDGHAEPDELVAKDNEAVGEIIIKSPAKSAYCYFNNPEMTAQKFYKGYLYTGDLGTWDENEFITVAGRKDDMIVSAGENIYPTQIEAILNEHPKVTESGVIGIPDRLRGESVAAYIVASDDSLTAEELKEYCAHHPMLSSYKRPRSYQFVKELPHTATGKLMHYKLREIALAQQD
ncbi:AMP-binding protein [Intestinibacillus massiliensis]|nr:AMP-binding protein [Intestinibacillus massiliensis]